MHDLYNDQPRHGDLLTPLSLHAAGNVRACERGRSWSFPGGGILAGLHSTVFSMQSTPLATPGTRPRSAARITPDPLQMRRRR